MEKKQDLLSKNSRKALKKNLKKRKEFQKKRTIIRRKNDSVIG